MNTKAYKKITDDLIKAMTSIRIAYGFEGNVFVDGTIKHLNEYGNIIDIIRLRTKSIKIKSKVKKLKFQWTVDPVFDLYYDPECEEELKILLEEEFEKARSAPDSR